MPNGNEILGAIYRSAVHAVLPNQLISSSIKINNRGILVIQHKHEIQLKNRPVFIFGAGKAVSGMCHELLHEIDLFNNASSDAIRNISGHLNVPFGTIQQSINNKEYLFKKYNVTLNECGSNNRPDEHSIRNTQHLLNVLRKFVSTASVDPLVLGLISGGGSALLALPTSNQPITLQDKQNVIGQLVRNGADIVELNTVRSCLSQVKNGQLAKQLIGWNGDCQLVTLIISDIIADPIQMIASGPTVIHNPSEMNAEQVLEKYSIKLDERIKRAIVMNSTCEQHLNFKASNIVNVIVGNNDIALNAAKQMAQKQMNLKVVSLGSNMSGEAQSIVERLLHQVQNYQPNELDRKQYRGVIWLAGGEATLTMKPGDNRSLGKGGRCQHMALLMLDQLSRMNKHETLKDGSSSLHVMFAGTDGQDGPTDAAGVIFEWSNEHLLMDEECKNMANSIESYDSYHFWNNSKHDRWSTLIKTGLTGTNVMDIYAIMIIYGEQ